MNRLIETAERAISVFQELGDELGLTRAWRRIALHASVQHHYGDAVLAWERTLEHATASGDEQEIARAADALCSSLLYGPTSVTDALTRVRQLIDGAGDNVVLRANAVTACAALTAMTEDFTGARTQLAEAREVYAPLGLTLALAGWAQVAALVALLAGEPEAAVAELRRGYELVDLGGLSAYRLQLAAALAFQLAMHGEREASRSFCRVCERSEGGSGVYESAHVRAAHALLAHDATEAARLAHGAVGIAERTDDVDLRASMQLTLARVTGDRAAAETARALYAAKGNIAADSLVRSIERDIVASI